MFLKIFILILFFDVMIGGGIYCRKTASNVQGFVLGDSENGISDSTKAGAFVPIEGITAEGSSAKIKDSYSLFFFADVRYSVFRIWYACRHCERLFCLLSAHLCG